VTTTAAVDGSALGNPGPAGWAWYIDDANWDAGGWPSSTNNRGELQAVIELLRATAGTGESLHILCDSKYVINSVTKWMPVWKLKGWKKANGKDVLNRDLMEDLDEALHGRAVKFEWVKGHSNHRLNDAADRLARAAAEAFRTGGAVPSGPGRVGSGSASGASDAAASGAAAVATQLPAAAASPKAAAGAPAAAAELASPAASPQAVSAFPTAAADASAGETERGPIVVSCPLRADLADDIVRRAQAADRTPQEELAELIALGHQQKYGES
jgi:ribonuclease HI